MNAFHAGLRLKTHWASVAADSGFRSTYRAEQATVGGSFTREDIMDNKWHARMAEHRLISQALHELPAATRDVLWLAFGDHKWPQAANDALFYKPIQGTLAGVAIVTFAAAEGAKVDKQQNAAAWVSFVVHRNDTKRLRIVREESQSLVRVASRELAAVLA